MASSDGKHYINTNIYMPDPAKTATESPVQAVKKISWEVFQRRYLHRENGFKYEWVRGRVEKSQRSMDRTQLYILRNLLQHFMKLSQTGVVSGQLIAEADLFLQPDLHRRPDVCWLTHSQINALARPDAREIPPFIIEIISSNDQINRVKKKLLEYREAGVQVVWHIYPAYKQVEVFTGTRLENATLYEGEQVCSAAPALPGFEMAVSAVFELAED